MTGCGVGFDFSYRADDIALGVEIGEQQQRHFALNRGDEARGIVEREDTIVQILKPVHQLATGHEAFVGKNRERLRHNCPMFMADPSRPSENGHTRAPRRALR